MQYDFKKITRANGQIMVGVSDNSVYFSSRFRTEWNIVEGECFIFMFDKKNKAIAIKRSECDKAVSYKISGKGYCKAKISSIIPQGRYVFKEKSGGAYILQLQEEII